MAKKETKLLTHVARGITFGDTSNSAVRNILTEISKELYGKVTEDQMRKTMEEHFNWKCPYTGRDLRASIAAKDGSYAADHIYPQNQDWCGLNVQGNLVLVDKEANNAKNGLDVETFLKTDTTVLHDVDNGMTRKERLDAIEAFQNALGYEPKLIRDVIKPLMQDRYKIVREEQEKCIQDTMAKLEAKGIKPKASKSTSEKVTATRSSDTVGKGYTYDEKLRIALYYLEHDDGLVKVEEQYMKLTGRKGATAKYILNKLGVDTAEKTGHKGLLLHCTNIDDEIAGATGTFKLTLEEIKKRELHPAS